MSLFLPLWAAIGYNALVYFRVARMLRFTNKVAPVGTLYSILLYCLNDALTFGRKFWIADTHLLIVYTVLIQVVNQTK